MYARRGRALTASPASTSSVGAAEPARRRFFAGPRRSTSQRGARHAQKRAFPLQAAALSVADLAELVSVSVTSLPSRNLRELTASTVIDAPASSVWQTLTSYETLHEFIPGLSVNECLERTDSGATLLQIGEANTAVGFRFKARVMLSIGEFPEGVPEDHKFHLESDAVAGEDVKDITFTQIEGDFKEYEGTWKMIAGDSEKESKLVYILRVKPQPWLPVSLVMRKVSQEVKTNLSCVRLQAQSLYAGGNAV